MHSTDPYRDPATAAALAKAIDGEACGGRLYRLMEVCGTHTVAIHRYGLRSMLPPSVELISGPGCPVCVTPVTYIDHAIALARLPDVILGTFGDLLRVPGSTSSLDKERAAGADVRILASPLDAIGLAGELPRRKVVFLGVGFETTAPAVALAMRLAEREGLSNFFVLSGHKTMPAALRALVSGGPTQVSGFIMPGHVSAVIGSKPYQFLADEFGIPSVVTGFEPVDVLQGILMLLRLLNSGTPAVQIQYRRAVHPGGNPKAWAAVEEMFEPCDDTWRGIAMIPGSGLAIRPEHARLDAAVQIPAEVEPPTEPKGCICGLVLQGVKRPPDCPLFGNACTPTHPVGACMVSSEGSCAAAWKYASMD